MTTYTAHAALPATSPMRKALGYRKFIRPHALRIVLADGAYHLHREAERALRALGHAVLSVRADYDNARDNLTSLLEGMVQHRPDFVLFINHIGLDAEGCMGALFEDLEMPLASWYCDSPMFVLRQGSLPAPELCSVFVWERSFIAPLRALGAQDVHHLPLGCDTDTFAAGAPGPIDWPLAFVGDSMKRPLDVWRPRVPKAQRAATDALEQRFGRRSPDVWQELLDEHARAPHRPLWDMAAVACFAATQKYRQRVLQQLDSPDLHVVGDAGWREQLRAARLHPPLAYGHALAPVYAGAQVSLNATSLQMASAVNQRVFDVPMAGGFVISDAQTDLFELFERNVEAVAYDDPAELPELVAFYRQHASTRAQISARARARIERAHTYRHRMASLCRTMLARHRGRIGPRVRTPGFCVLPRAPSLP